MKLKINFPKPEVSKLFPTETKLTTKIFLASILIGLIWGIFYLSFEDIQKLANSIYADLLKDKNPTFWNVFTGIFQRNITAAALTISLGIIYKYLPLLIIVFNGIIFGIILSSFSELKIGLLGFLFSVVPHGIFEIPAFIISGALGVSLARLHPGFSGKIKGLIESYPLILFLFTLFLIAALIESALIAFVA